MNCKLIFLSFNLNRQVYLLLWVGIFVDFADAALEDVGPAHFKEVGQRLSTFY